MVEGVGHSKLLGPCICLNILCSYSKLPLCSLAAPGTDPGRGSVPAERPGRRRPRHARKLAARALRMDQKTRKRRKSVPLRIIPRFPASEREPTAGRNGEASHGPSEQAAGGTAGRRSRRRARWTQAVGSSRKRRAGSPWRARRPGARGPRHGWRGPSFQFRTRWCRRRSGSGTSFRRRCGGTRTQGLRALGRRRAHGRSWS